MTTQPTPLTHLHTLHHPTGTTRSWSSRAHPSPRTPLLATASSDRSTQIWDLRDFKLVSTIAGGHKRSVRCVGWKDWGTTTAVAREEKPATLATGSFDANAGLWVYRPEVAEELDVAAGAEEGDDEGWMFTTLLTGPDSEIKDLSFCPPYYAANLLATCSRDKSVWVWEEVDADNEWETVAVLAEHTGDIKCVAWCTGAEVLVDGEKTVVGCREVLASGSYDDTIRLWRDVEEEGDWVCVGVVTGHKGTVWDLCWEAHFDERLWEEGVSVREWEPRIVSCSDDMTVRVWRRNLSETEKEKKRERLTAGNGTAPKQERLPSVIRPQTTMEGWIEETQLPEAHVRSIYAVDWSKKTGLVVSCGGDGTIAVYREVLDDSADTVMNGTDEHSQEEESGRRKTKWIIVSLVEAAHNEYEINHVCWAPRRDKEKRWDGEEVVISTGDDGDVRIWTLPEEIVDEHLRSP